MKVKTGKKKSIEFVEDLNYENYLEKADIIIASVNMIVEIANLSTTDLHKLTGLHVHTLRRVLRKESSGRLKTFSKLNSFVLRILEASIEAQEREAQQEFKVEPGKKSRKNVGNKYRRMKKRRSKKK